MIDWITTSIPLPIAAAGGFGLFDWIQTHIPPWVWITLVIHFAILGTVAYLILLERKVASWVQDRIGPNRVGPFGLLQPIADGIKFILKEDYRPKHVDKILFTLAPAIMVTVTGAIGRTGSTRTETQFVSFGSGCASRVTRMMPTTALSDML